MVCVPAGARTTANNSDLHLGINPVIIPAAVHPVIANTNPTISKYRLIPGKDRNEGNNDLVSWAQCAPNRNAAIETHNVIITCANNANTFLPRALS